MDENTAIILKELADKLGTTAEYLWAALLKQSVISGTVSLVMTSATIIIAAVAVWLAWEKTTKCDFDIKMLVRVPTLFFVFVIAIIIADTLATTIAAFFNPEYWALMQILNK